MTNVGFKTYIFYKIVEDLIPRYLTKYVNLRSTSNCQTSSAGRNNLPEFSCRTERLKHSFFSLFDVLQNIFHVFS